MPTTSKSINAQLLSLLPGHTTATLPAPLVDLTSALAATSRARISKLKGEEEVGREYVCAYMAVEKLKGRLNLPDADLKPPVPPRVFQRMLATFEKLIPISSAKIASIASNSAGSASASSPASASKVKPAPAGTKRKAGEAGLTASSAPPPPTTIREPTLEESNAWLHDFLRWVETELVAPPNLVTATMAGLAAIFPDYHKVPLPVPKTPAPKRVEQQQEKLARTVVAVMLGALPGLGAECAATDDPHDACRWAVEELIVRRLVRMTQYGRIVGEAYKMYTANARAWMDMQWFKSIEEVDWDEPPRESARGEEGVAVAAAQVARRDNTESDADAATESAVAKGKRRRTAEEAPSSDDDDDQQLQRDLPRSLPGSMRNKAVDYLSPEYLKDFERWSAALIADADRLISRERDKIGTVAAK